MGGELGKAVGKDDNSLACPIPTILQKHIKIERTPTYPLILSQEPDEKGAYAVWSPPPGAEPQIFLFSAEVDTIALDDWREEWSNNGFEARLCWPCAQDPRSPVKQRCYQCMDFRGCGGYRLWVWKQRGLKVES